MRTRAFTSRNYFFRHQHRNSTRRACCSCNSVVTTKGGCENSNKRVHRLSMSRASSLGSSECRFLTFYVGEKFLALVSPKHLVSEPEPPEPRIIIARLLENLQRERESRPLVGNNNESDESGVDILSSMRTAAKCFKVESRS